MTDWDQLHRNRIIHKKGHKEEFIEEDERDYSCLQCHPIVSKTKQQFQNFWNYITNQFNANTYSGQTSFAFEKWQAITAKFETNIGPEDRKAAIAQIRATAVIETIRFNNTLQYQ
jgi:hypothetical protein